MSDVDWQKSSHSNPNGNCVEISWQKSSYTGPNSNCVELSDPRGRVRDSKDPDRPKLHVNIPEFIDSVKSGRYDPK